ncbi:MAG: hypothetical protein H6719_16235 [Sandaracinaceae bacterium]|nr:hypothetical protein [Sandaracinaceae bacterium]
MTTARLGLSVLLLLGCAGVDPGSGGASSAQALEAPREDQAGSTRASRELATAEVRTATAVAPAPVAAAPAPRPLFAAHPIDATEAEDGHGALVPAAHAIAFDLDGRRFPVRARDPVLHVGELTFHRYAYPSPGLLRFVAADAAALPIGAPVFVQYDDDEASRVVVADALELP